MNQTNYTPDWKSLDNRPLPEWFSKAKFGIFIHWGVYSVPAWRKVESEKYGSYAEWYYARVMYNENNGGKEFHLKNYGENFEYRDFAPAFKAELFDPKFYAELFQKAGAKYVVLTSKHHDGFCLWPSKNKHKVNWNAVDIGPKRDLVGDLTKEVKASGLKMGLYYSIVDWETNSTHKTDSGYFIPKEIVEKYGINENDYPNEILMPQLKELVEKYEPSLIFSDGGEWDFSEEYAQTKEFLTWLYNESSVKNEIVVNDRFHVGMPGNHGDYYSSEYQDMDISKTAHPWEENRGIGGSYGFNRAENFEDYSSSKDLILELVDIVSRGGNLLLNVGPASDGTIPVVMQERLIEIGNWLKVNGEGIYDSSKINTLVENHSQQKLYFTRKNQTVYCFFTKWNEKLVLKNLPIQEINAITLVGTNNLLSWEKDSNTITIELPRLTIDELPCMHCWCLKII